MTAHKLCAKCNVCTWMPEQEHPPKLVYGDGEDVPILFVDDAHSQEEVDIAKHNASIILGKAEVKFAYTTAIRCLFERGTISLDKVVDSVVRCSVWTHMLLENRAIIVTTTTGLLQMGVDSKDIGSVFKSSRLGLVMVVPPLFKLDANQMKEYRTKMARLLEKVKL